MSNNITASNNNVIKIFYKNNVATYVSANGLNTQHLKELIEQAVKDYKKDKELNKNPIAESDDMTLVWRIDCLLNMAGLAQMSLQKYETMVLDYDYDLGENEEEEDLKRLQHTDKKEKLLESYRRFFKCLKIQVVEEQDQIEYIYIFPVLFKKSVIEIVKEIEELEKEVKENENS